MNTVFGTQMHWLTLVFIFIGSIFFFIQVYDIAQHPNERKQWWYLILLFLLLGFNLTNGLFPDSSMHVPLKLQYIFAYGFAYLMGTYFPFYFYRTFELEKLRFHAFYGVVIFLLIPYLIFDVILFALNNRLIPDRELGVVIPALYGIIVLIAIFQAILRKHSANSAWPQFTEALAVWAAILPWELMSVFAFVPAPQWLRIGLGNLGWLVITLLMIVNAVKQARRDNREKDESAAIGLSQDEFLANCLHFGLTRMEILVVQWVYKGKSSKEIAELIIISEDTVKKHIQNAFRKVGVRNRVGLIHKLLNR